MQQILKTGRGLWVFAVFCQLLLNCACVGNSQVTGKGTIKAAEAFSLFPNLKLDSLTNTWRVATYDSQFARIYYYGDWTLYRISYTQQVSTSDDDRIDELPKTIKYFTIISSKNSDSVYKYDTTSIKSGIMIGNKDSVFARLPLLGFNVDSMMNQVTYKLIDSKKDGDILHEQYSVRSLTDSSQTGTLFLTFSGKKLKDIPYSWGKNLEAKKKLRLAEIVTIMDGRYIESCKCSIEKMELPNTLTEVHLTQEEESEIRRILKEAVTILH
ncbi:MAG: hypothetical protein DI535_16110 [Citrobacter freundii]|nr:MAG: hypothetical protein DI535_16110 [Citrobacter freundii]